MTMKRPTTTTTKYPNRSCHFRFLRWTLDLRSLAAVRKRLDQGSMEEFV